MPRATGCFMSGCRAVRFEPCDSILHQRAGLVFQQVLLLTIRKQWKLHPALCARGLLPKMTQEALRSLSIQTFALCNSRHGLTRFATKLLFARCWLRQRMPKNESGRRQFLVM